MTARHCKILQDSDNLEKPKGFIRPPLLIQSRLLIELQFKGRYLKKVLNVYGFIYLTVVCILLSLLRIDRLS